jgi:hypothetical protein
MALAFSVASGNSDVSDRLVETLWEAAQKNPALPRRPRLSKIKERLTMTDTLDVEPWWRDPASIPPRRAQLRSTGRLK